MSTIKITQIKSYINCSYKQKRTIKALGLGKIRKSKELPNTPAVNGMISKVKHLLEVENL